MAPWHQVRPASAAAALKPSSAEAGGERRSVAAADVVPGLQRLRFSRAPNGPEVTRRISRRAGPEPRPLCVPPCRLQSPRSSQRCLFTRHTHVTAAFDGAALSRLHLPRLPRSLVNAVDHLQALLLTFFFCPKCFKNGKIDTSLIPNWRKVPNSSSIKVLERERERERDTQDTHSIAYRHNCRLIHDLW